MALPAIGGFWLLRPISAERSRRLAIDLENGVFDCATRFPRSAPGSFRDLWEFGAGQLEGTALRFQTRTGDEHYSPAGRVKVFPNVVTTSEPEPPARKLHGWTRYWKYVYLETDGGLIQLAGSEPTCTFIEGKRGAPENGKHGG